MSFSLEDSLHASPDKIVEVTFVQGIIKDKIIPPDWSHEPGSGSCKHARVGLSAHFKNLGTFAVLEPSACELRVEVQNSAGLLYLPTWLVLNAKLLGYLLL